MCMEPASSASIFCRTAGVRHMMWRLFLLAFKGRVGLVLKSHYTYTNMRLVNSSLLNDPNTSSPANVEASNLYKDNRKEYTKRVRETVEKSWEDNWANKFTQPSLMGWYSYEWAQQLDRLICTAWGFWRLVSCSFRLCILSLSSFMTSFSFHFIFSLSFDISSSWFFLSQVMSGELTRLVS